MNAIENRIFKTLQEKYKLETGEDISLHNISLHYREAYNSAVQNVLNEGKIDGTVGKPFSYDALDELAYDICLNLLGIKEEKEP